MEPKEPTLRTLNQPDRLWSLAMVHMTHDEDLSLAKALELAARELMSLGVMEWEGEVLTAEEVAAVKPAISRHLQWTKRARIDPDTLKVTVIAIHRP